MILYELYVQDPEMHISRAIYFPSLTFAVTIRCPNLLRMWEKLKDFFFLCIILKKYTPTFQATNLI